MTNEMQYLIMNSYFHIGWRQGGKRELKLYVLTLNNTFENKNFSHLLLPWLAIC